MLREVYKPSLPRPFLKWAGGKGRLIGQYIKHFPTNYRNYHEPFLGGGAVFFYLRPRLSILTDINPDLITTYCCVRDRLQELISLLKEHEHYHSKDYYYNLRAKPGKNDVEIAARFIYLNRTCFNGLYRVNSKGEFNVPLGRYNNPKICQIDLLFSASELLKNAEVKVAGFEQILDRARSSDDFVYLDPPYHPISNTSYFTAYSRYPFGETEQTRLRDSCTELASRGVKVMISNSDCQFIRQIYSEVNFNIYPIKANRAINSNVKKRGTVDELIITSY